MKLDMCRGFGWICVDLGLSREMMFPRIYVIKIERCVEESYILLENMNIERIRSEKELYEHMRSLIELLCKDRESRMYFMSMGKGGDGREEV